MSDSDSRRSSTSSSSSSDDDYRDDVDEAEIKLQQMRRKARAKAEAARGGGQSRMAGLQSYEDMKQEHALKRTEEGLKKVLSLHTPGELSSICGGAPTASEAKRERFNALHYQERE